MDSIRTILALDTTGPSCSVAVCHDGITLAETSIQTGHTHGKTLTRLIRTSLDLSGLQLNEVDALAVTTGPGSFTGIRIGIATAKGIALAAGLPVLPVTSLEALALPMANSPLPVCALLDARGDRLYAQLWLEGSPLTEALATDHVSFAAIVQEKLGLAPGSGLAPGRPLAPGSALAPASASGPVILVGSGAQPFARYAETIGLATRIAPDDRVLGSAVALAASYRMETACSSAILSPEALSATYLSVSQAERLSGITI